MSLPRITQSNSLGVLSHRVSIVARIGPGGVVASQFPSEGDAQALFAYLGTPGEYRLALQYPVVQLLQATGTVDAPLLTANRQWMVFNNVTNNDSIIDWEIIELVAGVPTVVNPPDGSRLLVTVDVLLTPQE